MSAQDSMAGAVNALIQLRNHKVSEATETAKQIRVLKAAWDKTNVHIDTCRAHLSRLRGESKVVLLGEYKRILEMEQVNEKLRGNYKVRIDEMVSVGRSLQEEIRHLDRDIDSANRAYETFTTNKVVPFR